MSAAHAQAQERITLSLEVPADSDCSAEASLRARIANESRTDATLETSGAATTRRIRVVVQHGEQGHGYRAQLVLLDQAGSVLGERLVSTQTADCSELDDALVVIVGTLLGMGGRNAGAPEQPATRGEEKPLRSAQPAPKREDKPRERARQSVGLGGLLGVGALPGAVLGAEAWWSVALRGFLLNVGGVMLPRAVQGLGAGAEARLSAWLGRVQGCGEVAHNQKLALLLCGGGRVGLLSAQTQGLAQNQRAKRLLAELLLGLRLQINSTQRLGFYGDVAAALPVRATRFYFIEGDGTRHYYHQSEPGVMGAIGLMLTLGG